MLLKKCSKLILSTKNSNRKIMTEITKNYSINLEVESVNSVVSLIKFKWQWIIFFSIVLTAWFFLVVMHPEFQVPKNYDSYGIQKFLSLCLNSINDASYVTIGLMWMLMSIAMMAPTAIPAIITFSNLPQHSIVTNYSLIQFIGGFLVTWFGYSFLATTFQIFLANIKIIDDFGQSNNIWLNAILLMTAGLYQFSTVKNSCVSRCRSPIAFFMEKWTDTKYNGLKLGLQYGVICVGCCWALMLLAFVGGIMNLAWMTAAMLLMTIEKLNDIGKYISKPIGVLLILSSLVFGFLALTY